MQQRGDKHGPLQDENLKGETQGLEKAEHETRSEAWRAQEASGEDQPDVDRAPDDTFTGASPPGMSSGDVEGRAEIAMYVDRSTYPAGRDDLVAEMRENNAPDRLIGQADRLPEGQEFQNVQEVWEALGGGVEEGRPY